MTDRVRGFYVVLDQNLRVDDAVRTKDALAQVKGVLEVTEDLAEPSDVVAVSRVKVEIWRKFVDLFESLGEKK